MVGEELRWNQWALNAEPWSMEFYILALISYMAELVLLIFSPTLAAIQMSSCHTSSPPIQPLLLSRPQGSPHLGQQGSTAPGCLGGLPLLPLV